MIFLSIYKSLNCLLSVCRMEYMFLQAKKMWKQVKELTINMMSNDVSLLWIRVYTYKSFWYEPDKHEFTGWTFESYILGAIIKRVVWHQSILYVLYMTIIESNLLPLPWWQTFGCIYSILLHQVFLLICVQYRFWYLDMFGWFHVFLFLFTEDDGALSWQKGGGAWCTQISLIY